MNKWKSSKGLKIVLTFTSILMAMVTVCSAAAVILIGNLRAYSDSKEEVLKYSYEKYSEIYAVMAIANRESGSMQEAIDATNFRYGIIKVEDPEKVDISDPASYEYYNFEKMPSKDSDEISTREFQVGKGTHYSWNESLFGGAWVSYETGEYASVEEEMLVPITGYYYNVVDGIFYYATEEEFYRVDEVALPVGVNDEMEIISFKYDSGQKAYYNTYPEACLIQDYYLTFNAFDNTNKSWETWGTITLDGRDFGHTAVRFVNDEYTYMGEFQGKPIADHYYFYGDSEGTLTVRADVNEDTDDAGQKGDQSETYWVVSQVRNPLIKTGIKDGFLDGDLFEQITFLLDCAYAWKYTAIIILIVSLILWGVSTVLVLVTAGHRGSYEVVEVKAGAGSLRRKNVPSGAEVDHAVQKAALPLREGISVQDDVVYQEEAEKDAISKNADLLREDEEGVIKTERRWVDAIKPGLWQKIPLDVETCIIAALGGCLVMVVSECSYYRMYLWNILLTALCGVGAYLLCFIWLTDFVIRVKLGKWWRSMWTYKCLAWIGRKLKTVFRFCQENVSLLWKAALILGGISLLECFGILVTGYNPEVELGIWFLYRAATLVLIFIGIVQANKLKEGAKKLADGDLQEKIVTDKMFWEFKKHGDSLNSIHDGISLAVEKRMQSEHFRTELITNVSHDIKTPLTSIINYVDLLQKEEIDNEKAKEYLEVLHRQSARLKKLTEDLIEASKASTGSMPVQMEKLELGVFLTQTVGEFEEKITTAGLHVVMHKPEQEVFVNADGRHLWRVVENLVQNICKYAQPGTRVYIDLDDGEKEAVISFKNISSYELNISGDALMERFVRGDSSRHTEGSGLGLSIAGSLMELMNGKLEIVVDGDLFKVVLHFPK